MLVLLGPLLQVAGCVALALDAQVRDMNRRLRGALDAGGRGQLAAKRATILGL